MGANQTAFGFPQIRQSDKVRTWGPAGVLVLAQVFVLLITVNGSNLIPGDWSGLFDAEVVYLILSIFALGVFGIGNRTPLISEGDTGWFVVLFAMFAAATIFVLVELFAHSGAAPSAVSPTQKIQTALFLGVFVAPTEELLFRVVLPPYVAKSSLGRMAGSSILFGVFHLPAYSVVAGKVGPFSIGSAVIEAVFLGMLLYVVYAGIDIPSAKIRFRGLGLGASTGIHWGWDLSTLGVVGGFAIVAKSLGLVPL
ncbi:MAG: CPBP family intramembrane metalloprotease [Euryarchaeota archaeon]|nr:CPBP family intramembrane metalloprotease [Euryarchaeota archaeon]MDE1881200.1 CPBP family intramembrane metalloprotease [Euryarchaeota archaeon]